MRLSPARADVQPHHRERRGTTPCKIGSQGGRRSGVGKRKCGEIRRLDGRAGRVKGDQRDGKSEGGPTSQIHMIDAKGQI